MTYITIITLAVGIMLLTALHLYKKDIEEDFEFFHLYGEHLYDQNELKQRGKFLFWVSIGNALLAIGNLFYLLCCK